MVLNDDAAVKAFSQGGNLTIGGESSKVWRSQRQARIDGYGSSQYRGTVYQRWTDRDRGPGERRFAASVAYVQLHEI